MLYIPTTALMKLLKLKKKIRGIAGGTSASKTIGILQLLIDLSQREDNEMISVTSESMPHLKRGAIRDFLNIMQNHNYFDDKRWNKSDFIYTFETGSRMEFFSADMPHKVRGARRDILFINEANNIPLETFEQLEVRTKKTVWLDWNPTFEFWFYTEILNNPAFEKAVDFLILTYKDNEGLDQEVIDSIERRKGNINWWKVYGLGELGELEGKIYTDWRIIDKVPPEARLERYGLDFGYSNDPATIVGVYYFNGEYILDEITYQKGLHNKDLADIIKNLKPCLTIADSAEPKSIDEIRSYGVNIIGAKKQQVSYGGKKSYLNWSIDQVQTQKVAMTKRSTNMIKEYRSYMWKTDLNGNIIKEPEPGNDHALDAVRYAITSLNAILRREEYINSLPHELFIDKKPLNPAR